MTDSLLKTGVLGLVLAFVSPASAAQDAQDYPSKPVRFVSATAPGGAVDVQARLFAQKLTESVGRPFVMDYKPGASNRIG
jgi:tripartite-type tricarboxylate transporter receptor subunit TctC